MENKEIKFIAKHYKKGLFAVDPALRRIRPSATLWWTRSRIAAACIAAVVVTAAAAVYLHNEYFSVKGTDIQELHQVDLPAAEVVRAIDFEEASLTEVVQKIREVYGVEVTNLPSDPDQYTLSLHYEGSALDLVDTINDILDTDMKVIE